MGARLAGKVALITGGGGGIGEATAQLFWEEGAQVAIVDNNADDVYAAGRGIDPTGERMLALAADLAKEPEAARVVRETLARFGRLDVLANVAGVRTPQGTIVEIPQESWDYCIGVNLMAVVYCSKHAIPEMARNGGGSIVNISSSNAWIPRPGWTPYDATKAAVLALSQDMACDHAAQNIRVNAICPGPTLTRFHIRNRARNRGMAYEQAQAEMRAEPVTNFMRRRADPRELAYAILFLACDESSFVTGTTFRIDGGLPLWDPTPESQDRIPSPPGLAR